MYDLYVINNDIVSCDAGHFGIIGPGNGFSSIRLHVINAHNVV